MVLNMFRTDGWYNNSSNLLCNLHILKPFFNQGTSISDALPCINTHSLFNTVQQKIDEYIYTEEFT